MESTKTVWVEQLLTEINKKLASGVQYQQVLDFALDSIELLIPYDRIGVAMLEGDENNERLRLIFLKSKIPATNLTANYSATLNSSSLKQVMQSQQPRIINDLIEYSTLHPHSDATKRALQDGIRSSLTCCLKSGKKCAGFLFFSSAQPNTYKDVHVETYLAIADELSMIVDYGRLKETSAAVANQTRNFRTIVHDLRSPLSVIEGFVRASIEEPWFLSLDEEAKEVFSILLRNTQSMFELLNELTEISHLDHAHEKLNFKKESLEDFYIEMLNFGRILAERKSIQFVGQFDKTCPHQAVFEKQCVRRALQNLFSNAVKFSRRGTKIDFSTYAKEGRIYFSVKDEGLGIPPSELAKLFKDFGKTSTRPTEGESSTGLGLSIVKRLVEIHEGDVSVTSEFGKGSNFTFWIPTNLKESHVAE